MWLTNKQWEYLKEQLNAILNKCEGNILKYEFPKVIKDLGVYDTKELVSELLTRPGVNKTSEQYIANKYTVIYIDNGILENKETT